MDEQGLKDITNGDNTEPNAYRESMINRVASQLRAFNASRRESLLRMREEAIELRNKLKREREESSAEQSNNTSRNEAKLDEASAPGSCLKRV